MSIPNSPIAIAYNATKQLLYKFDQNTNKATVIYDDVSYTAPNNRQMKLSQDNQCLYLVTKRNEISVLTNLDSDDAKVQNQLKNIPGDEILDFCEFGHADLLALSKDGYLSCYDISSTPS